VTIYGKGKPLALAFSGAHEVCTSESFLTNTVSVARTPGASVEERAENKGYIGRSQVTDFSAMPRQDYALAAFHLDQPLPVRPAYRSKLPALPTGWPRLVKQATSGGAAHKRQVLFVKGAQAHDATYFVFRDTVEGGQPTVWNMWTLSQKLGMTDETRDLEAFLSDAPGNRMTSARELDGDRFTAFGQFDVDMDYYVALPTDTPRATLRWGYDAAAGWPNPWHEYQDLLHLQRADDGAYYVALFPRRRGEPAPEFATLGGGTIIRAKGSFGTDYAFLNAEPTAASADGVSFSGMAGSVQDRSDGLVLALGARGQVSYGGYRLTSEDAASAVIRDHDVAISTSYEQRGAQVLNLGLPDGQVLSSARQDVQVSSAGQGLYQITIPEGVLEAQFTVGE
jgi:hypothetical protein